MTDESILAVLIEKTPNQKLQTTMEINPQYARASALGLLIADTIRHLSKATGIDESEIFEWVEKERDHPTTEVETLKPN